VLSKKEKAFLAVLGLANLGLMTSATSSDVAIEKCNFKYQNETISVREVKRFVFPLASGSLSGQWVTETSRAKYNANWVLISNEIIGRDSKSQNYRSVGSYNNFNSADCIRLAGLPHDYVPNDNQHNANTNTNNQANNSYPRTTGQVETPTIDRSLLEKPYVQFALSLGYSDSKAVSDYKEIDLYRINKNGENVLFFSLQEERDAATAIELLKEGVPSNGMSRNYSVTPLMLAAGNSTIEVLQLILTANKNQLNLQSTQGASALMYAASSGRTENVKALLNAGANKNLRDKSGATAEDMARQQNFLLVADLIATAR
jgi:Ankyrin repeats (3 copies)